MIINRVRALGGRGGAGRGRARSERGRCAGLRAAPSLEGSAELQAWRAPWRRPQVPFCRLAEEAEASARSPLPSSPSRIRPVVQPLALVCAPAQPNVQFCARGTSPVRSPRSRRRGFAAGSAPSGLPAPTREPQACDWCSAGLL